jgi:hypothetical protein
MAISRMDIVRGDNGFTIRYDGVYSGALLTEKGEVVRFLDDCIDAIMRLTNRVSDIGGYLRMDSGGLT